MKWSCSGSSVVDGNNKSTSKNKTKTVTGTAAAITTTANKQTNKQKCNVQLYAILHFERLRTTHVTLPLLNNVSMCVFDYRNSRVCTVGLYTYTEECSFIIGRTLFQC